MSMSIVRGAFRSSVLTRPISRSIACKRRAKVSGSRRERTIRTAFIKRRCRTGPERPRALFRRPWSRLQAAYRGCATRRRACLRLSSRRPRFDPRLRPNSIMLMEVRGPLWSPSGGRLRGRARPSCRKARVRGRPPRWPPAARPWRARPGWLRDGIARGVRLPWQTSPYDRRPYRRRGPRNADLSGRLVRR